MVDMFEIYCDEPVHARSEKPVVLRLLVDQDIGFAVDFAKLQHLELLDGRPLEHAVRPQRKEQFYLTGRIRGRYALRCELCSYPVVARGEKLNLRVMELHRHGKTSLSLRGLQGIL